jgi:hypothetical protein
MITFEKYTGFFNDERGYLAYADGKQVAQIEKRRSQWHVIHGSWVDATGETMTLSQPFKRLRDAKAVITKRHEAKQMAAE